MAILIRECIYILTYLEEYVYKYFTSQNFVSEQKRHSFFVYNYFKYSRYPQLLSSDANKIIYLLQSFRARQDSVTNH